jgi:hypothetical protein
MPAQIAGYLATSSILMNHLQAHRNAINALRRLFHRQECRYLIEKMELETGIEPATSSLGIWGSFVNKELMRPRTTILIICTHGVTALARKPGLSH